MVNMWSSWSHPGVLRGRPAPPYPGVVKVVHAGGGADARARSRVSGIVDGGRGFGLRARFAGEFEHQQQHGEHRGGGGAGGDHRAWRPCTHALRERGWRVNETWCVEFVRDGFWTFVGNVGVGVGVGLASVPVWVLVVCVNFEEVESV